jgi:hypothetical protein
MKELLILLFVIPIYCVGQNTKVKYVNGLCEMALVDEHWKTLSTKPWANNVTVTYDTFKSYYLTMT